MTAIIRGSRQTVAQRYEMHAQQKRQQALANMPPQQPGMCYMPSNMPCGCMQNMGMYSMSDMCGMPGMMDMSGMSFCGMQLPPWVQDFFVGNEIGKSIYKIGSALFGKNSSTNNTNYTQNVSITNNQNMNYQNTSQTLSRQTVPNVSNLNTSFLRPGSTVSSISQGNIDGRQTHIATVTNSDGTEEQYALTRDNKGNYNIGAKLTRSTGSNYTNQAKLNEAIQKEFGGALPSGYSAELVGDTLVVKDPNGLKLDAAGIAQLKADIKASSAYSLRAANQTYSAETEELVQEADKDNSETISYQEFTDAIAAQMGNDLGIEVSDDLKAEIEQIAKQLDVDGNGEITKQEIEDNYQQIMTQLAKDIGDTDGNDELTEPFSHKEDILAAADLDDNKQITEDEWDDYRESAKEFNINENRSFQEMDKNGDGVITEDELE